MFLRSIGFLWTSQRYNQEKHFHIQGRRVRSASYVFSLFPASRTLPPWRKRQHVSLRRRVSDLCDDTAQQSVHRTSDAFWCLFLVTLRVCWSTVSPLHRNCNVAYFSPPQRSVTVWPIFVGRLIKIIRNIREEKDTNCEIWGSHSESGQWICVVW
jgi:hypothetical protein